MKAILDGSFFLDNELKNNIIDIAYIPTSIINMLNNKLSLENYSFNIILRDPEIGYVKEVMDFIKSKNYTLSQCEIDFIALSLEISDESDAEWIDEFNLHTKKKIICLTKNSAIKSVLSDLNISFESSSLSSVSKLRCFACFAMYDYEIDFCKLCGHNTITRVSVDANNKIVSLKDDHKIEPKIIKDDKGNVFYSADQPEYIKYKQRIMKNKKKN